MSHQLLGFVFLQGKDCSTLEECIETVDDITEGWKDYDWTSDIKGTEKRWGTEQTKSVKIESKAGQKRIDELYQKYSEKVNFLLNRNRAILMKNNNQELLNSYELGDVRDVSQYDYTLIHGDEFNFLEPLTRKQDFENLKTKKGWIVFRDLAY